MSAELENLLVRRDILRAYVSVLERPERLIEVLAASAGDGADSRAAVAAAFDLGPIPAEAVLDLQVRRLTPTGLKRIREELAEIDDRIAKVEGA